jgi:hypothetical protein
VSERLKELRDAYDDLAWLSSHDALGGVAEILQERRRQIEMGHTAECDDVLTEGGLVVWAEGFLRDGVRAARRNGIADIGSDEHALRAAGALAAAEMDRMDRASVSGKTWRAPVVKPRIRLVSEMFVKCSLPVRPDAMAASDCCGYPAVSAVVLPDDNSLMYRCHAHWGIVTLWGGENGREIIRGEVVEEVPRPASCPHGRVSRVRCEECMGVK